MLTLPINNAKKVIETQSLEPSRVAIVIIFIIISAWYFIWRLETFNPQAKVFSYALYAAELFGVVTALLHIFMTWRLTIRIPPPPQDGLSVDVFITTINEPVELIRRTVLAATNINYPHQTWLLDDGRRPEMEALAQQLGVRYLTRSDNEYAKAGSLNNALRYSTADFVAVFDADHAPHTDFLHRTLGYFCDPAVAFVQTPQDFFNLDSYQHRWQRPKHTVWTEQSLFFRVIMRGKDAWNAAFFCGSCAVLRRSALDGIGGFAIGTVTEDLHTSIRIHKKGYESVYHAESLAFGLAPPTIAPFLTQRVRWGQGAMQVWRKEGILFKPGLSFAQRLNYLASSLTYFDGWQKAFFYLAPVIVLLTGTMPIRALNLEFLLHFIPYYLLTFWVFEETGRGYGRTVLIEQYNMARFAAFIVGTLGIFRKKIKFLVSEKTLREANIERYTAPQFSVLLFNGLAIPIGTMLYSLYHHLPLGGFIANIVWAGINAAVTIRMLGFTRRCSDYRRIDYRFPIPLPAKIQIEDHVAVFATIDNISSSGCRIYARFNENPKQGEQIKLSLFLPSASISLKGKITTIVEDSTEHYIKAVGCHFLQTDTTQHDSLDLFLYGTDLQWQLLQLNEAIRTPIQGIKKLVKKDKIPPRYAPHYWATIVYSDQTGALNPIVGLISVPTPDEDTRFILVFQPLPQNTKLISQVFTRTGHATLEMQVIQENYLSDSAVPVYLYKTDNLTAKGQWQTEIRKAWRYEIASLVG